MAWSQGGESAAAIDAHAYLQPAVRPRELVAEIQRYGEQAVGDARRAVRDRIALLRPTAGGVVEPKAQIVAAVGGICAVIETALVSEGSALAES